MKCRWWSDGRWWGVIGLETQGVVSVSQTRQWQSYFVTALRWYALYVTTALPWMAVLQAMHGECARCMHAETSTHLAEIVLNLADDHGHGLGRAVLCELRHEHVALAVAFVELFRCFPVRALGAIDMTSGSVPALATDL